METTKQRVTLPTNVCPKNYRLTLKPDLVALTFNGEEEIQLEVIEETKSIVLNAMEVNINLAELVVNGQSFASSNISYNTERETATIEFAEPIKAAKEGVALKLTFTGILNDQLKGFYSSKYTRPDKTEAYMAVTQFEATDARRAFPCWDEPALKASFDVTLIVPKTRVAISNMPVISETEDGELKSITFDRSPIMSTYLLAFIVGEFDMIEDKTPNGVSVRVFTPLGKGEQGQFALEVATKTLPFYDDYFGIPYPLPKCDLIAIADFAAGAMENWGAITYRETALLVDPSSSSAATRQWVALVVGHELAHQWFGNLVTMEWWTHLWLNEGFATWIEYLCVDHCFPDWDIWTQFVYSDLARAFDLDGLKSTHPVEVEVADAADIDQIFDAISYSKGCSIIRMLASYLGADAFKQGLHSYLNEHQYANATTEDLWKSLAQASGKAVKEMMGTWTKQNGYPVIIAEQKSDNNELTLTQTRFLSSGETISDEQEGLWHVPLGVISDEISTPVYSMFKERSTTLSLNITSSPKWIKVNPNQTGFFRVKYSLDLLEKLKEPIQSLTLSANDRLGVEGDAFALARAGQLPTTHVLTLLEAFRNETNYTVWADLSANLRALDNLLVHTPHLALWNSFCCSLYSPIANAIGWAPSEGNAAASGESHLTALTRSLVISRLGLYGDKKIIEEAKKRFNDPEHLSPDLRAGVYQIAVANGDASTYEAILKIYRETDLHEEKMRCLRALGFTPDEKLLQQSLEFALSDEVRSQDKFYVIRSVADNPKGAELAWQFAQQNWSKITSIYSGGALLSHVVKSVTEGFASEEKVKEVTSFFEAHPTPTAERAIHQSIERIQSNARWLSADADAIGQWLNDWNAKQ